jgi:hypothetical protein
VTHDAFLLDGFFPAGDPFKNPQSGSQRERLRIDQASARLSALGDQGGRFSGSIH